MHLLQVPAVPIQTHLETFAKSTLFLKAYLADDWYIRRPVLAEVGERSSGMKAHVLEQIPTDSHSAPIVGLQKTVICVIGQCNSEILSFYVKRAS